MLDPLGDLSPEEFKEAATYLTDWLGNYLAPMSRPEPVLSQWQPGDARKSQPKSPPKSPEPASSVLREFQRELSSGLTHWNSPRFFAYFSISASAPGVLADFLASGLNQQAMLWRTSPVATELEEVTLDWLRQLMALPQEYRGVIYDTASVSTLHALAAARDGVLPHVRQRGAEGAQLVVYCSEHTHSSVDKAILMLGLGLDNLRKIPCDELLQMKPELLAEEIQRDKAEGRVPCCVVATTGTTSTSAVDPVSAIQEICESQGVWLHVDAAYGGAAAILPECRHYFAGWEKADSIVFNPHKWLFTPFDCSVLFVRDIHRLTRAFSLQSNEDISGTPEYLKNSEEGTVLNLMDTGIQLGRRFRSLKLWMIFRCFGSEGIRARVSYHLELAEKMASWIEESSSFEMAVPLRFSLVCFRLKGADDASQMRLMDRINKAGKFFLSHTKIHGRIVLRCAIGHIRTSAEDIELFCSELEHMVQDSGAVGKPSEK